MRYSNFQRETRPRPRPILPCVCVLGAGGRMGSRGSKCGSLWCKSCKKSQLIQGNPVSYGMVRTGDRPRYPKLGWGGIQAHD